MSLVTRFLALFAVLIFLGMATAESTFSPSSSTPLRLIEQNLTINGEPTTISHGLEAHQTPTLHRIALPSTLYLPSNFSSLDASRLRFSLIVAVKDYGPRNLPILVQMLSLLQEQSQKELVNPIEIFLVHVGPADTIQHDVLGRMTQLFSPNLQYLGPRPPNASMKLSTALNDAAALATGDILFFSSDMLEDISIASILNLAKHVLHSDIGIVGPKLVDASRGGTTVFSSGLDFLLGKNPHKPSWTSWYVFDTYFTGQFSSKESY